jgi:hypothetical protein
LSSNYAEALLFPLGLRDPRGKRPNEVRKFMAEQMSLPPLPTKQLRAKAIKVRHER